MCFIFIPNPTFWTFQLCITTTKDFNPHTHTHTHTHTKTKKNKTKTKTKGNNNTKGLLKKN